jgi:hypothetical protein
MKILTVIALAAVLTTSSFAFAQTGTTSATGAGTGSTGVSGRSDPGIDNQKPAQQNSSKGDMAGSGTPGTRTTGAGMSPSDRATGTKSGN